MSDYGINIGVNVSGEKSIDKLFNKFKQLEKQVDQTKEKLELLEARKKELKQQSNALTAAWGLLSTAAKNVIITSTAFIESQKKIKEEQKKVREETRKTKNELQAQNDAAIKAKQTNIDNAKSFAVQRTAITETTSALRGHIEAWNKLSKTYKGRGAKGTINTLFQSITKADFTANLRDLKQYVAGANEVAKSFELMAMPPRPDGKDQYTYAYGSSMQSLLGLDPGKTESGIKSYINVLENLRGQLDRTGKQYRDVTQRIRQMNTELSKDPFTIQGISAREGDANLYGPKPSRKTQMFNMPGGMFYERGGMAARKKGALNSALIGGAFPALFGQGLGASIGGGVGGYAGGMLGGGLGFGLSLVGTQIGAQFDRLVQSMNKAGTALADFNKDTDQLIESLGLTNSQTALRIKNLKQLNGEQAAYDAALAQMTAIVGEEGVQGFKTFADETRQINTDFQQLFLMMGASLARLISFTRILKGLTDGINNSTLGGRLLAADDPRATALATEIEGLEGTKGRLSGKKRRRLTAAREEAKELLKTIELENTRKEGFELITKEMEKQQKINNTFGFRERERIANAEKVNDLAKEYYGLTKEALSPEQTARLEAMVAAQSELVLGTQLLAQAYTELDKELIQLNDSGYQVVQAAEAIGSAFSESFKGIVSGSMSAQQALANLFQRTADHFLDMAAQMIAKQIQMKILGIGLDFAGYGFGSGIQKSLSSTTALPTNVGNLGNEVFKAAGGPVSGGSPYIVGERGPELFVPGSSGNIVPNHEMGGANIVVNVDASGSEVQGNEGQAAILGRAISSAVTEEIARQKRPGGLLSAA